MVFDYSVFLLYLILFCFFFTFLCFSFIRVVGHGLQHIHNLIFLHKNNPPEPPPAYISPKDLGIEPTLMEQMQFLCTIPNNHYGTSGTILSLLRNICIPFPNDKVRPASIRNKVIAAVATNDKKYLFFALKFYHDYRKYLSTNIPIKTTKRNKLPTKHETQQLITQAKAMLVHDGN